MKQLLLFCLLLWFFTGCKKESNAKVEIYLLQSFTRSVDVSAGLAITRYSDVSLSATPLVANSDIVNYNPTKTTFYLRKDIGSALKDFGPDKAFAVTVNKQIIYMGEFRPAWLSSVVFGIATINPAFVNGKQMPVDFIRIDNYPDLKNLDRRNDERLLNALLKTGRLL
ncbi:MAG TPA: hypothetical protein VGN63_02835 [Flavisolibacter sp.]|jgi:hypothetical protein|nr:hypothetical protein [Flavisolibacter sp.]